MNEEVNGIISESPSREVAFDSQNECPLHADEVKRFQELLQEDPEYAYRRCGLALLYSLPGEKMIEELQKFGWKAQDAQDLYNLGTMRSLSDDHSEALKYYQKAVELDPQHWSSYFNMGLTYRQLDDSHKAKASIEKCIQILEAKIKLYNWEKNNLEEAKRFLEEL